MSQIMEIKKGRRMILIITIIVSLVFMCSIAWGGYQYTWVKVTGTVADSSAIEDLKTNRYKNIVYYSYIVDGHEYSGQYTDTNEISSRRYTKNSSIEVYYSPFLPNLSTARTGIEHVGAMDLLCFPLSCAHQWDHVSAKTKKYSPNSSEQRLCLQSRGRPAGTKRINSILKSNTGVHHARVA